MTVTKTQSAVSAEEILANPDYFLYGFDPTRDLFTFIRTNQLLTSQHAFLDGRTSFALDDNIYGVSIHDAQVWQERHGNQQETPGLIFHVGFCGSTLLARALDLPGRSFTYREPQVLIDLADLERTAPPGRRPLPDRRQLLQIALSQLNKSWSGSDTVIVKPSNWANSLLARPGEVLRDRRAILLTMELPAFLTAVFRGGHERIAFCCRLAEHLASGIPPFRELINESAGGGADNLHIATRICAAAWLIQVRLFNRVSVESTPGSVHRLTFEEMMRDPCGSLRRAADFFGIPIPVEDVERRVAELWPLHSKNPGENFDRESAEEINARVQKQFGGHIDEAMVWLAGRDKLFA